MFAEIVTFIFQRPSNLSYPPVNPSVSCSRQVINLSSPIVENICPALQVNYIFISVTDETKFYNLNPKSSFLSYILHSRMQHTANLQLMFQIFYIAISLSDWRSINCNR